MDHRRRAQLVAPRQQRPEQGPEQRPEQTTLAALKPRRPHLDGAVCTAAVGWWSGVIMVDHHWPGRGSSARCGP